MYYHLDKIRAVTLKRIPTDNLLRRAAFQKFMISENLVSLGIFNKVYTYNSSRYIDEESFTNYMNSLFDHLGLKVKTAVYLKCQLSEHVASFIVETFETVEQFREIEAQRKVLDSELRAKRRKTLSAFNNPLPIDLEDKKLMAIDFEFLPNGEIMEPVEMGISIQHNGMRTSFNYSFVENQKNNFHHGNTVESDKSSIVNIFKEHFVDVDYLVGHNLSHELHILTNSGIDEQFFENVNFIDTSCVTKNEFHFLNCDHVKNQTASLRTSLRTFAIPYTHLHVAGNDASYTLDVLNQLVFHKANSQKKKANKKIQVISKYKRP